VLTVGFIVTVLVCFTGFLIYWILSIKSRVLQFGIFRAMGMSLRNIVSLLINEQIFITLTAVAIGAVVGEVSSRLFVPLIQISFTASEQVIPLMITTETRDYMNLFGTIGFMVVICLVVLGVIISRIKIAQALKLGED
jgi:putative ABC transport system permease protein